MKKWIAQGYGQGEGAAYRPFFHVRDVPSKGRSAIVEGLKTGRVHHYLSDIEYHHHILAEFSTNVVDIREQYALLPWEETQEIARDLEIAHPMYPSTKTPLVMTSDLVLTLKNNGLAVISVKYSTDVEGADGNQERTLEKLRIEQEYWKRRGVPWVLSTEKDICVLRAKNLAILRTAMVSCEIDSVMAHLREFVVIFQKKWEPHKTLSCILLETGETLGLSLDVAFCLFGRAVWLRRLPVDLDVRIDHFVPVNLVWN
ncbi:TnsA endonuclease N-terminal domain-containing protein [Geomonas propionica]|uniref:Tn7 transposase TnsA N-terminal domain-containing protein n=1 Tax=Geomonas propionica TaxID=2798582 RepID=A0ABS0YLN3_9BACT|nr:TnsA endonuclease N-terminal domain-containing protein [Geomonas propionica]MBJ6798819.1 Tn7 transposase TnsA N-terminal domain-containing protein [Geomonas propionica]